MTITIESPEKISFTYETAQLGARIGGFIIDLIIQALVIILTALLIGAFLLADFSSSNSLYGLLSFFFILSFSVQWGYFVFFESLMNGQSPGKKLTGITVISESGEFLSFSSIALRNLIRVVDSFPVPGFLGGLIAMMDKKSRRFGDITAGTLVVKVTDTIITEPDFTTALRPGYAQEAGTLPWVEPGKKLSEKDLWVIRTFLNQKWTLPENKRREVMQKFAETLKQKVAYKEKIEDPLTFIETVYRNSVDEDQK